MTLQFKYRIPHKPGHKLHLDKDPYWAVTTALRNCVITEVNGQVWIEVMMDTYQVAPRISVPMDKAVKQMLQ